MELDSNFASLLRNLKVDDPWVTPKSWESIPSESGSDRSSDSAQNPRISTNDPSSISESVIVRLAINALQGLKSAVVQTHHLSVAFCSTPTDRTFHQFPSLWCRSSSTSALGSMLKSLSHSGLVVFLLQGFVNHHLYSITVGVEERGEKDENEMKKHPPYSLVNQAFSVAVGKVLEGYVLALNTLLASVKLRRSVKHDGAGILTSVVYSDITLLEVFLHTEELRTRIEALGNICFPNAADFTSLMECLTSETVFGFHDFPRGAELLTYLYVLLRDADPGHHALLKFLFIESCEPYHAFIKSWIYHAKIDDPYGEFFAVYSHGLSDANVIHSSVDEFSLSAIKERDDTSVPCFLKDTCGPLIRAGQQLDVLVKLLNICKFAVNEEYESSNWANLEAILPFWGGTSSNSPSLPNQLTFSRTKIQTLLHKREIMYEAVLEKLQTFFTTLDARHQRMHPTVIPFGSLIGRGIGVSSPFLLISGVDLKSFSATNEHGVAIHEAAGDTDATSCESLFEMEPSELSESSSSCSYEDEVAPIAFSELHDISYQPSESLVYNLHACNAGKITLQIAETEKRQCLKRYFLHNGETLDTAIPLVDQAQENGKQNHENEKLSQMPITFKSDVSKCVKLSNTSPDENMSGRCWPLGALSKNPFCGDMKHSVPRKWCFTEFHQQEADGRMETLEEEETDSSDMFMRFSSESDATGKAQVIRYCDNYNLSANPMVAKTAWIRTVRNVRDRDLISNCATCYPHFQFLSVSDPFKGVSESMISSHVHESHDNAPKFVASVSHAVGVNETCGGDVPVSASTAGGINKNSTGSVLDKQIDQSVSSSCSSRQRNDMLDVIQSSVSGGSGWEGLLNYPDKGASFCNEDECYDPARTFEIPLDVIIDKRLVQEILIQYKYVSNFAIKLLKEGFDLQEHLVALRRYHFMEQADWADSFIISLYSQKWSSIEPDQKVAKIQKLLDLALQRSSCGHDPYKQRLFAYAIGQNMIPEPTYASDLHAFDFLALGYRVDWPVNIIITQCALKTYAEIFRYLFQVRLAVISLTDVWHWLKAGMYSTRHSQSIGSHKLDFRMLMKMRQQLNHFVRTLQEYVHCHLSDVSWCQFQHSLQHQVKDILDLESVHKSYLADAMHICFMSTDTKPIAIIVKKILQCALDFRLCFSGSGLVDVRSDGKDPMDLCCRINFSQVFAIKTIFERNIKDLYILYLRSPKHGEFSLCRFWSYLNFNDYYSSTIAKEMI